ncbi:DUF11 domain-containing protein [Paludisphaera rhizosphaerae]|uniref:DUF11 domain-containing protein n=1 Tax=Paludisphaera rhizosphaerae TaxID=2711216 RepID=UPI0013ECFF97|nr:DUF11 domain-containing protein [Paludisphaera rhizosphaerae]
MSRHERPLDHRWIRGGIVAVALGLASASRGTDAVAQDLAPAPTPEAAATAPAQPAPTPAELAPVPSPTTAPVGVVTPEGRGLPVSPLPDPNIQPVRFSGPEGLAVEVLSPQPSPASIGDNGGFLTTGLQRKVGYRLRLSNIPNRPEAELFPVVEVVGHMHRPAEIDPGKYPIRIVFTEEELWDVVDHGRLITKVIYLEDPDQALPLKLPKDKIPVVEVNPAEDPVRVAAALGRVIAIVRLGGRRPTIEELNAGDAGDLGLDRILAVSGGRCPYSCGNNPCQLPSGPACPPLEPGQRPVLPRDEYLCDGGDRGAKAGAGPGGAIRGVDPRDAVVRFDVGLDAYADPKILPTNRVCIYAPRFAEIRVSTGTIENVEIHGLNLNTLTQRAAQAQKTDDIRRLVQNQAAELARDQRRVQAARSKSYAGESSEVRGAMGYVDVQHPKIGSQSQSAQIEKLRQAPVIAREKVKVIGIKTAEAPIVAELVQGTSEAIRSQPPLEMTGIETPPNRPGLAVVKRVDVTEAEPGDTVTYAIAYRNMGNTPIRSVSIIDSLLPRLEYVAGSAKGPKGSAFTVGENTAGSTELRWDLKETIPPGASGYVSFQAIVR